MRAYLIAAATLTIACGAAFGQAYRWVDDQGRVHYTQTPPPVGARDVQRKNLKQSGAAAISDLPYATQVAVKNFPVTLYTQPDCGPPCDGARAALVKRAVPFTEISVVSQNELDEVKRIAGSATMPLLVVGSLHQTGYREDLVNSLLDTAGYPTSVSPLPLEALRKPTPAAPSESESK